MINSKNGKIKIGGWSLLKTHPPCVEHLTPSFKIKKKTLMTIKHLILDAIKTIFGKVSDYKILILKSEKSKMSIKSYIYAASSFIPKEVVKSEDLMDELKSETKLGISRTIINDKMGIFERRFSENTENRLSDLATKAAENLMNENNIDQ